MVRVPIHDIFTIRFLLFICACSGVVHVVRVTCRGVCLCSASRDAVKCDGVRICCAPVPTTIWFVARHRACG